uniref:Sperm flagellar 1 n=1 Tax=Oryzias sinensis TaxID=183150 RepID=A0A8C7X897_9TELE
ACSLRSPSNAPNILLSEEDLFAWIDKIPLSRPKRNISRDFSDGVMAAEVVKHFFPKLVDLHNYIPANSTQQKLSNWNVLNRQDKRILYFDHLMQKNNKPSWLKTCDKRVRLKHKNKNNQNFLIQFGIRINIYCTSCFL